jgi:hypothetical protein
MQLAQARLQASATSLGIARPYDPRHSYASLRFAERTNPAEIAEEMGHSLEVLFNTYAHVIADLKGTAAVSAEALIFGARRGHILVTSTENASPGEEVSPVRNSVFTGGFEKAL